MKQKMIQIFLIIGIVLVPIFFIFRESTDLSVRYIAIILSILSSLLSIFISLTMMKFVYKIFIKFSKESLREVQTLFLGYIFLNSLVILALKDTPFFKLINIINPTLLIFLSILTIIYSKPYGEKKCFFPQ